MRSSYINVKNWRKNTKLRLIEAFGGSCGICGYNKCETALEFHHLNPKKKELLITSRCRAWTKTVDEARKCIMLCANCHREIHTGLISLPKNIKRFNEDLLIIKLVNIVMNVLYVEKQNQCHKKRALDRVVRQLDIILIGTYMILNNFIMRLDQLLVLQNT